MTPPPSGFEPASVSEIVRVETQVVEVVPKPLPIEPAEQPHRAPQSPRIPLELPPDSGLVLVETTHTAAAPAEEAEPPRARRVRPPRAAIADEPLQMVETVHKESTPPSAE